MGLFDRLRNKLFGPKRNELAGLEDRGSLSFGGTIKNMLAEDAETIAQGRIPERRLIPHHAIKRDVIIAAYEKDFKIALEQMKVLNWVEIEKTRRVAELKIDFEKHISGVKQVQWQELDKIISLMTRTRTDLKEIENDVRSKKSIYSIVDPL